MSEFCDVESIYRLPVKEIALDLADLPSGCVIPPLAPLSVDFAARKAKVCRRVRVSESAGAGAVSIKVSKGTPAGAGMLLGTGTAGAAVAAIDRTNADYDVLTLQAAFGEALTAGQTLFEAAAADGAQAKDTANFLNYAAVKAETGAAVTIMGRAYSVFESKLLIPLTNADKEKLTARFMFV